MSSTHGILDSILESTIIAIVAIVITSNIRGAI